MAVKGVRKMLFANLYDEREVELVAALCVLEGVTISNLMRRAIASMCDEQGIERPSGVFDDRAPGNSARAKKEIADVVLRKVGRPPGSRQIAPMLGLQKEPK